MYNITRSKVCTYLCMSVTTIVRWLKCYQEAKCHVVKIFSSSRSSACLKREWSTCEVDRLCSSCCSLGCQIKGSNCVIVLDNEQLLCLKAYNALFVLYITHCFKQGSHFCVQSLSNLMHMFIIYNTPENIFDVHHLVDLPHKCLTVDIMSVANVSHSACMTYSCVHHSTINFDPLHAARHAL